MPLNRATKSLFRSLRRRAVVDYERAILNALEPFGPTAQLLDCGCDDGRWTLALGKRVGTKGLSGIEIVEDRRRAAISRGISARAGNLNGRFPFPSNAFDVVHANQVIEHLHNTDSFVTEIWRVLKWSGYAVVCTENLASWHNLFALLLGWQPFSLSNVSQARFQIGNPLATHQGESASNPKSWQHLRVFAYQGLVDIFAVHGFTVETYTGSGYYPLPPSVGRLDPRHAAFLTIKVRKCRVP